MRGLGPTALPSGDHSGRHPARDRARLERRARTRPFGRDALHLARSVRRVLLQHTPGCRAARLHGRRVPRRPPRHHAPARRGGRLAHPGGHPLPGGRRSASRARRGHPAREPPLRGCTHRHAHRPQEPPRARPRAPRRGRAHAQVGRAPERRHRRPRLLQVRERPARPPCRRRGARPGGQCAAPASPRGRLHGPHRRRGVHDPAAGRHRARGLSPGREDPDGGRARVPQRSRRAHLLLRGRDLPRPRRHRGLGPRSGRPGALRRQGARPQPLRDLQPRAVGDLRSRGRARRRRVPALDAGVARRGARPARYGHRPTTRGPSAATPR